MSESFHDQVAQLRRKQILDAAITVFAERGFHRTTIRDIARAAGVADGTIYNYFANKSALLIGILDPLDTQPAISAAPLPDPSVDVRQFFRHHFAQRWLAFSSSNMDALRVVLSEVLVNPELRPLFVEHVLAPAYVLGEPAFQHLVASGRIKPLDVTLTLRTLTGMFIGILVLRLIGDEPLESAWDEMPDLLTTMLFDGLMAED